MDRFRETFVVPASRRHILRSGIVLGSALLAAACGGAPASPTAAPKAAEPTKPAAAAPTTAPAAKPAEPTKPAAAAPTTAPAAKPAEPTKPAAAATTAPAAAPAGQVKQVPRGRTLIMAGLGGEHPGAFTDVDAFNQYLPGLSRSGYTQGGTEGLFYFNMLNNEDIPWIGESYQFNPGFTEVTVKLRKGVEWSDGKPFTAKDVAFTFEMLANEPALNNGAEAKRQVKSVQAVDDQTVKFTLNFANPRFVFDMLTFRADIAVPIAPEHVFKGQDPKTFKNYDPAKGWPLVTGPYKLVATTVEQKIWDRRDDWWGAKTGFKPLPKVERLVFLPGMNEITMAQKMIANEIDMAFSFTPANMRAVQAQNKNVITHSDKAPFGFLDWWPIGLGFNHLEKPFDDPEIRWAISYAINRDQIIKFAFSGFTQATPIPYPDYAGLKPYLEALKPLLEKYPANEFNLKKTDEIMTKKGYKKDGQGMWVGADGNKIPIQIVTFPQHPSTTPQAPIVTEQLRQAGFDATFQLPADFVNRIYSGEAKAFLWGHGGSMREPFATLDRLYHMKWFKPAGQNTNGANLYRWNNKPFSDIVDQMGLLAENDPKLMDLWLKAMEIWLPELPDAQLIQTVIALPMNTTYWKNWPSAQKPYIHEGFWHRTGLIIFMNLEPVS
ncbi:MAG: ABC transporter substrate-binding protein [Chloroflexi bacterium]|nr:ABC transporter substrate-binding protein [Chloroflexota bacterium]